MIQERGKGDSGALLIIAFVVYMSFVSYLMYAVYGDQMPLFQLTSFNQPAWLTVITGAWLVWVFQIVGNFFILLAFTISGHGIPLWFNIFFTVPFVLGMGWMIVELIRG